jgi:hypothetical protein
MTKPIEEQIVDVMRDYRMRRMRHMVNNPDSVEHENEALGHLSKLAEAHAIYLVVKADLQGKVK